MTITEIINKVKAEKQTPGRFPARIIFARNWNDYIALVDELRVVCDVVLNLANYTNGDILPKFKSLKQQLRQNTNKMILLLSMGEYLRLCAKREQSNETMEFNGIWEPDPVLSERENTKYVIPIFGGRELFDNAISYVDKRQEDFLWELDETNRDTEYTITIYSPEFTDVISVDANCFSDWLAKWNTLFAEPRSTFSLKTKLYKYAVETLGSVKLCIVNDPFTYITARVTDAELLKREYGNDIFWKDVAKNVQAGKPFIATIDYILNVARNFDAVPILARFQQSTETERTLLWMRCKMYASCDYVSYAISITNKTDEIPLTVRDAIFTLENPSKKQLAERYNALCVLDLHYDDGYFKKLKNIFPVDMRFTYLTFKTQAERAYAIRLVGELLRKGADITSLASLLKPLYPSLAEYCMPSTNNNNGCAVYFDWYRKNKLMNIVPSSVPSLDLNLIVTRNKVIQTGEGSCQFWIDGMGAEWLPLLLYEIRKLPVVGTIKYDIARAILPTATEYNHQWEQDDIKWDRLDKLSHTGAPDDKDFYSNVATQIDYICEVAQHINLILESHNNVIVTGDHGSSRLAALSFHSKDIVPISIPTGATVRALGRFCELTDGCLATSTDSIEIVSSRNFITDCDVICAVVKTYEHYKQSGNAILEVHGGATPEEQLVPVIFVSRIVPIITDTTTPTKKRHAVTQKDLGI